MRPRFAGAMDQMWRFREDAPRCDAVQRTRAARDTLAMVTTVNDAAARTRYEVGAPTHPDA